MGAVGGDPGGADGTRAVINRVGTGSPERHDLLPRNAAIGAAPYVEGERHPVYRATVRGVEDKPAVRLRIFGVADGEGIRRPGPAAVAARRHHALAPREIPPRHPEPSVRINVAEGRVVDRRLVPQRRRGLRVRYGQSYVDTVVAAAWLGEPRLIERLPGQPRQQARSFR